ncbi:uncharacterized protein LOC133720762 [Rosa rugosa]|uniref:uncharacterized protein LOC133720762 n=1 Tax=Rosa rugosa TaxID=74645 RepID=UPI002B4063A4|nr:uncharacterized protein LOC133720762 [Rosa rugosa]
MVICTMLSYWVPITEVEWTKLVRVSEEVPIVCMDLLSEPFKLSSGVKDWIAVGDGKVNMTVVGVIYGACTPRVGFAFTWSAGIERQLLRAHWCQSLGYGFIFTTDPRGTLKLWRLCDHSATSCDVSLLAEFTSSFGSRIMCLDASLEEELNVVSSLVQRCSPGQLLTRGTGPCLGGRARGRGRPRGRGSARGRGRIPPVEEIFEDDVQALDVELPVPPVVEVVNVVDATRLSTLAKEI